jgi:hypothetical protein
MASKLYKAARTVNDIETLASGDPEKIARRAKNKLLGRLLGQAEGVEMSPSKGLKFQFFDVICAVFPNNTTMLLKIFI